MHGYTNTHADRKEKENKREVEGRRPAIDKRSGRGARRSKLAETASREVVVVVGRLVGGSSSLSSGRETCG